MKIKKLEKTVKNEVKKYIKGSQCSVNGIKYEKKIFNIVKYCVFNNKPFNTQKINDLAGCSAKNDLNCNFKNIEDLGIEIKKFNTPDWMQCSIKYDFEKNKWFASKRGKNNKQCQNIFNDIISNINLYNGDIPPFMKKSITHTEWLEIKKKTNKWNDKYFDIPSNIISKLYKAKGCDYIQISNGYGLYHLENDICNFGVPLFNIEQHLRVRTKVHKRKNKNGFCNLSVTIACKPKNIKNLVYSKFTLEDKNKLPKNLIFNY